MLEFHKMAYLPGFKIETKVKGVTFDGRQAVVAQLTEGETVWLIREPTNPHDPNAIRVERKNGEQIGYIDKHLAANLAPKFDKNGESVAATITEITGGYDRYSNLGVRLEFVVPESEASRPQVVVAEKEIPKKETSILPNEHRSLLLQIFSEGNYGSTLSREITILNAHTISNQFLDLIGTIFCLERHHDIEKVVFDAAREYRPDDNKNIAWLQIEDKSIVLDLHNIFSTAEDQIKADGTNLCLQGTVWLFLIDTLLDFIYRSRYFDDGSWKSHESEFENAFSEWREKTLYELADTFRLTIEPPDINDEPYFGPKIESFFEKEVKNNDTSWALNQLHMKNEHRIYNDILNEIAVPTMAGYLMNTLRPAEVLVEPVRMVIKDEDGREREPFEMPFKFVPLNSDTGPASTEDSNVDHLSTTKSTTEKKSKEEITEAVPTSEYPHYRYPFKDFNPVQSRVYHQKDNPNNMIIAANTSAGKTIAAELLIDSTLQKGRRVIYLSPFKALTEEKYAEWQKRYPDESLMIMTGDYELSDEVYQKVQASNIIVMTSEMMDSRTRKFHSERNYWMKEVGLVIVDEAHILSGSRGDKVETGIMRFTLHCPEARILFLSATMSNAGELGDWLTSLNGKETDKIQIDWRPVKLQMHYTEYRDVINGRGNTDYQQTEYKKIQIAIDQVLSKPNEKFLIFAHTKNTGYSLRNQLRKIGVNAHFHNADLALKKRRQIEESFKDRENGIRVLVSTSTTAWGVNLPARNVIILGVNRGFSNRVDELDIIQMAGRAGRIQYDKEGHVFLIIPAGEKSYWEKTFKQPRPVTSVLNDRWKLAFHVLAEIYRKTIKTASDLFSWYGRSLAVRQGLRPFSKREAEGVFQDLKKMNMIHENETEIQATRLGIISAVMYYPPYDIHAWYKNFRSLFMNNLASSEIAVAWALANIPSNKSYVPKDFEYLKSEWGSRLKALCFYFDPDMVLHIEAAYNFLTKEKANGRIRSIMNAIRSDAQRTIKTLRMIDERYAYWQQGYFWDHLEKNILSKKQFREKNLNNIKITATADPQKGVTTRFNADSVPDEKEMKDSALDFLFNIGYTTGTWQNRKDVTLEKCPECGATAVIKGYKEVEISAGTAYDDFTIRYCYKCEWRKEEEESYVDDFSDIQGPIGYEDEQERLREKYGEGGFETDDGYFIPESYDPS
jgi:superfamily II DNA or RNA helicase